MCWPGESPPNPQNCWDADETLVCRLSDGSGGSTRLQRHCPHDRPRVDDRIDGRIDDRIDGRIDGDDLHMFIGLSAEDQDHR